jgi:hypothetical protein
LKAQHGRHDKVVVAGNPSNHDDFAVALQSGGANRVEVRGSVNCGLLCSNGNIAKGLVEFPGLSGCRSRYDDYQNCSATMFDT